jgi:flagellar biosynthesis protein FliR
VTAQHWSGKESPGTAALSALKAVLSSALNLVAPAVSFMLCTAGIVGLLMCLASFIGPSSRQFPLALAFGLSIGCLVGAALFSRALEALRTPKKT